GKLAVGDHDAAIVESVDNGVEDGDFPHRAEKALGINDVTYLEGLEDQDQHATGKVGQAALQGQTHRQAGGTDDGNKGGGSDAHHGGHGDQQQNLEDGADQATEEFVQGWIFFAKAVVQHVDEPVDQPQADNQCDNRQQNLWGIRHDQRNRLIRPF